jgi:hypothetical protein
MVMSLSVRYIPETILGFTGLQAVCSVTDKERSRAKVGSTAFHIGMDINLHKG